MSNEHPPADGSGRGKTAAAAIGAVAALRPALASIPDACRYLGNPSRSKFYADLLPHLDVVRFGNRTFVTVTSLDRLVAANNRPASERSVQPPEPEASRRANTEVHR